MSEYDVCIIGSGAGGAPVAQSLAQAGHHVLVLEKGPWWTEVDFYKDELAASRRDAYKTDKRLEPHVVEDEDGRGGWSAVSSAESGWDFWNGNCVGGSSNFMSGFFHRLRAEDFRLLSEFGPIEGANLADWPISYDDLEPWYTRVEELIGVSGEASDHPFAAPRSTPGFPQPPTLEHGASALIDAACDRLGWQPERVSRAILSRPDGHRRACEYSGYCGSFGCSSGAKGSARAGFLDQAVTTGRCTVRPLAQVTRLISGADGRVQAARFIDENGVPHEATAKVFVVACQAIESSRLLLNSPGPRHPDGLGNTHAQVGRNLVFSAGGAGSGYLTFAKFDADTVARLKQMGPFVNRALTDWYFIDDRDFAPGRAKGGLIEFLLGHPNPTVRATSALREDGRLLWGRPLKRKLERWFSEDRRLDFEVFNDWLPTDNCFVSLDRDTRDRFGMPAARVRIGYHPHDLRVGNYLAQRGEQLLREMGCDFVSSSVSGAPPPNLMAGGCRFGTDPRHSVLDRDCRVHDCDNLYVTDAGFMPTGGSVPYTWTIFANALRVAERIATRL
ncbi:MAG: GMC family oxidoreductase [Gammaproteobacteria bacterium]